MHGLNEGHIAPAYAVTDHWLHTFESIVPQVRVPIRHILSRESEDEEHENYNQCIYYIDILNAIDRQQKHHHNMLNQAMTQVKQVSKTGFITLHGLNEGHIAPAYAVNDHWLHTFELIVPWARVPKRHGILSCESEDEGH